MAEKTEKPTEKKRRDSAKKGQTFKSKDLITTVSLLIGFTYILLVFSFNDFITFYTDVLFRQDSITLNVFILRVAKVFFITVLPFIALCAFTGVATTLLQTRFTIATEAIKLNFKALNPIQGFKRLFSIRTIKELVKSVCYLVVFISVSCFFINHDIKLVLSVYNADLSVLTAIWLRVSFKVVITFIVFSILVLLLDFISEYYLHFKDLKMDKHEVKREYKESDGNPEIKYARRRAHHEILSGEEMAAVRNSEVVLANPTHIAIAIYFNPDVASLPFVALRVTNQKAKAAISYAETIGIPVVRNIPLARRIYHSYSQYAFIALNDDALIEIMNVLIWLRQVEETGRVDNYTEGLGSESERNTLSGEESTEEEQDILSRH